MEIWASVASDAAVRSGDHELEDLGALGMSTMRSSLPFVMKIAHRYCVAQPPGRQRREGAACIRLGRATLRDVREARP